MAGNKLQEAMEELIDELVEAIDELIDELMPQIDKPKPAKILGKPAAKWTDEDIQRLATVGYDQDKLTRQRSKALVDELLELEKELPESGGK